MPVAVFSQQVHGRGVHAADVVLHAMRSLARCTSTRSGVSDTNADPGRAGEGHGPAQMMFCTKPRMRRCFVQARISERWSLLAFALQRAAEIPIALHSWAHRPIPARPSPVQVVELALPGQGASPPAGGEGA